MRSGQIRSGVALRETGSFVAHRTAKKACLEKLHHLSFFVCSGCPMSRNIDYSPMIQAGTCDPFQKGRQPH